MGCLSAASRPRLLKSDQMPPVATTPAVEALLRAHAPVAIGVSGGKDSQAAALATNAYLDSIGHHGPRALIHSDPGSVEWQDSLPGCIEMGEQLGTAVIVVRRRAGGMMERLEAR